MPSQTELSRQMGEDEPLLADGRKAPDRREISIRWLSGTFLTGVTSSALMGIALFAALDGREQLAIPGEAFAAVDIDEPVDPDAGARHVLGAGQGERERAVVVDESQAIPHTEPLRLRIERVHPRGRLTEPLHVPTGVEVGRIVRLEGRREDQGVGAVIGRALARESVLDEARDPTRRELDLARRRPAVRARSLGELDRAPEHDALVLLVREARPVRREQLADVKCPRTVDFREELPRHPTGKLYKRLLKDEYWAAAGRNI